MKKLWMLTFLMLPLIASAQVDDSLSGPRSLVMDPVLLTDYELPPRYLLKGAIVHTATGVVLTNGDVLVIDGRITEVGQGVDATVGRVIDLNGMHLYPGLVSASSPLGLVEIAAVRATRDLSEVGGYTPDVRSWLAVNPDSELIPVARAGGIAYSLAIPAGGVVSGQSGLIQLAGWGMEEMAFAKPVALHLNWPRMELRLQEKERMGDPGKWKSPKDQEKQRQEKVEEITEFFRDARAYLLAAGERRDVDVVPAWEAMRPYLERKKPVFVHADDLRQIKGAVAWAGTNGVRIVICGGQDAWMAKELLAEKKVPVVYEHVFEQPARDADAHDQPFRNPGVLTKAGVEVAISLGMGRFSASVARDLSHAAAHAARHGMTDEEALQSITIKAARILGVSDRVGTIEKGKLATLIATDGPLLDVRSNVKRMWIEGVEQDLSSRHTRLYRRYQSRPKR
ncbi:MAG: amidohydrolase family protein [Verrucomicrobiae bacterium]|nr:amidohydrolase family protein [Verrucomicrobiae bacterium]